MNLVQFKASRSGEVGVQSQYLDGELYLVDNALAGSVAAAEKLQVLDSVVRADAVDVVDGFSGEQVASEMFGHDIAVFHSGVFFAGNERRHGYPNVAVPFDVSFVFTPAESVEGARSLRSRFTLVVAEFCFVIKITVWAALQRLVFAALFAGEHVVGISRFSAPECRALHGTVERISTKLLEIRFKVSGLHFERPLAFLTGKLYRWNPTCSPTVLGFKQATARNATALLSGVFVPYAKSLLALFTNLIDNRHGFFPLVGSKGTVARCTV